VGLLLLQAQQVLRLPLPLPSLHIPHQLSHPTTILPHLRTTPTFLNHPRHSVDSTQTVVSSRVLAAVDTDNIRVLQHIHPAMWLVDTHLDTRNTKLNLTLVKQVQLVDIKQRVHLQQEATSSSNKVQLEELLLLHQDTKPRQASGTD